MTSFFKYGFSFITTAGGSPGPCCAIRRAFVEFAPNIGGDNMPGASSSPCLRLHERMLFQLLGALILDYFWSLQMAIAQWFCHGSVIVFVSLPFAPSTFSRLLNILNRHPTLQHMANIIFYFYTRVSILDINKTFNVSVAIKFCVAQYFFHCRAFPNSFRTDRFHFSSRCFMRKFTGMFAF